MLEPNPDPDRIVILELLAEGGSLVLTGKMNSAGWTYELKTGESALGEEHYRARLYGWLMNDYRLEAPAAHLLIGYQARYDVVTVAGSMALKIPKRYLPPR